MYPFAATYGYSLDSVVKVFHDSWTCLHSLHLLGSFCYGTYVLYTFLPIRFPFIAIYNFGDHCGELMCGLI